MHKFKVPLMSYVSAFYDVEVEAVDVNDAIDQALAATNVPRKREFWSLGDEVILDDMEVYCEDDIVQVGP